MGEVYQATDTNLKREVALKVLPASVAADAQRLARFQREAEVLAALNHPNIAQIYGLEKSEGIIALVMELVEGDDLSQRIAMGAIPIDEALPIAQQIAEALEAAHEQGIIHRDLKPANIKVRPDGQVKVLDFGLAKAMAPAAASEAAAALANSPTITSPAAMTAAGMILGTAAYMSPEQARGKTVDKRTDIWAFGCVLYEMLTGWRAFVGETMSDTIAAILDREPDWKALPALTPPRIRELLRRCLEKDPKRRLRDIGDARISLDHAPDQNSTVAGSQERVARSRAREYLGWVVAVLLLVVGAATAWRQRTDGAPSQRPVIRTAFVLPVAMALATGEGAYPIALSSDGARFVYVSEFEGRSQLYVRDLDASEPTAMPGTTGARHPFFSPDGQWVGFFAGGALQKIAVAGGAPLRICNVTGDSMGATWGPDGTIVLALRGGGLSKVSASGGTLEPLPDSTPAAWPEFLPDGRTVLYTTGAGGGSAIAAMSVVGGMKRIVARMTDSSADGPALLGTGGPIAQARFVSRGYLVYGQSPGIVRAIPFDVASLTPTGSPIPLFDSIERGRNGGAVYFAVSRTGLLVYASTGERHQLVWVDRNGTVTPVSGDREAFREPRLSPDGTRIAVAVNDETRRSDIWIYDAARGTKSRLTTTGHNLQPVWTHDGTQITFSGGGLVQLPADGSETRKVILPMGQLRAHLAAGTVAYPTAWSPDGRTLVFQADEVDMWRFQAAPPGSEPVPLLVRPSRDSGGQFSPDGRWIAYTSDESGRPEVYVGRYPDLASKIAISAEGGVYPHWSREGHELFYRQGDALMAAAIDTTQGFRAARPQRLFAGPFTGTGRDSDFDVAPGGQRFVMIKSDDASTLKQLTIVQNWFEALERRAPTK